MRAALRAGRSGQTQAFGTKQRQRWRRQYRSQRQNRRQREAAESRQLLAIVTHNCEQVSHEQCSKSRSERGGLATMPPLMLLPRFPNITRQGQLEAPPTICRWRASRRVNNREAKAAGHIGSAK